MADRTSEKINEIRLANGWKGDHCPTCTRSPHNPYRRYDNRGKVLEGCVDACHEGKLVTPSESARWHSRKEAKDIRRAELKSLQGIKGR